MPKQSSSSSKSRLWDGKYTKSPTFETDQFIISSNQLQLDSLLLPHDIEQNIAYSLMLVKQDIISNQEGQNILKALLQLDPKTLDINPKLGLHMTIESLVTQQTDAGKKMHTGRSRNDQISTITRMYLRQSILAIVTQIIDSIKVLQEFTANHLETLMIGFTHTQPAQPMTFGFWSAALAQALVRDMARLQDLYPMINQCPLGSAASFGTTWPIDRNYLAQLLGFESVQVNTLDAVTSRGEFELDILHVLNQIILHLSHHTEDLILWLGFGLIHLSEQYTHGSSIMPQKQNPDTLELIRANCAILISKYSLCANVLKALPTGYNRDSRETKAAIFESLPIIIKSLQMFVHLLPGITPNSLAITDFAQKNHITATDAADQLARNENIGFRDAHTKIGHQLKNGGKLDLDPIELVAQRNHIGSPAPNQVKLQIQQLNNLIETSSKWVLEKKDAIETANNKIQDAIQKVNP